MRRCAVLCLSIVLLLAAPPPAPQHLTATPKNGVEIDLTWDHVPGAAFYRIYRGIDSHKKALLPYGIKTLFFHNTTVTKGTTYYYQVSAVNGAGQEGPLSAEVSASLGAATPHPVTHPAASTASDSMTWETFLFIVALLLLGAGIALFAWQRTRGQSISTIPTARLGALPQGGVANFPSGPFARPSPTGETASPESVRNLPATIFPGEGLVARYGVSVPPAMSDETGDAPPPMIVPSISSMLPPRPYDELAPPPPMQPMMPPSLLKNSEPLHEHFTDGMGVTTFAGAPPPPEPLVPNHLRQLGDSGRVPVWPGSPPGAAPDPHASRTLLFLIAGTCVVLGIMALVLFALLATSGAAPSGSATQPTVAAPTATSMPPSPSPTVVATPIAINAGGGAVGAFSADAYFSGGQTANYPDPIDTSQVQNPAPQQVYQTERYGEFTYTIPNLTPGATYTVRLHFAEVFFTDHPRGKRVFNVAINGQPVLTNFDIAATAGGPDIAIVEQFSEMAQANGTIQIRFTNGTANEAKISGIEIVPNSQD
jgi:hypothetical protein